MVLLQALFRALKTKHDTPKYGLIYHASLVGQSAPKHKGKISRVLAGKTSLAARVDALGDAEGVTIGFANREKVEARLRSLEAGRMHTLSGNGKDSRKQEKYVKAKDAGRAYNPAADIVMTEAPTAADAEPEKAPTTKSKGAEDKKEKKKRKAEAEANGEEEQPVTKKSKKDGKEKKKTKKKSKNADA